MGARVLGALALAVLLTGCGTASAPSPPTGVDELVIPTSTPDPDDFVTGVDNPWFPLEAGTVWTYSVADTAGSHRLTVAVDDGPEVDGVPTTARVSTEAGTVVTDWYAQDDRGNVWWFGRDGQWQAGENGAEAGLVMAAAPRIGDGYRMAYAPGVSEDIAVVDATDVRVTVPVGTFETVVLQQHSELTPGLRQSSYAEGLGLVEEQVVSGSYRVVRLVTVRH